MESFVERNGRSAEERTRRLCVTAVILSVVAAICSLACLILLVLSIARKPTPGMSDPVGEMYRAQQEKLDELEAERQRLEDRLDELSRENEELLGRLEYTDSLEGLLEYARENLGYVFPDDTIIDDAPAGQGG